MTEDEKGQLEQEIRDNGQYPVTGEQDELDALEDKTELERRFCAVVVENIRRWMEFADERLRGTGIRCFITPGNDDFWEIDEALQESDLVEFVEGRCVRLDETHEMITTGISNVTPWASPRELEEKELAEYIESMSKEVDNPESLIAVLHVPPLDTGLDQAPEIDSDFRVKSGSGGLRMTHVGSIAVREFIELHQPLVGLHGHVHESRGAQRLGRTLCINPGSEYTDGVLSGALVTLATGKVSHQFVAG
jgi:Icc-related predicted phosphoesterase